MLFVFSGSDYKKSLGEAQKLLAGLQKKQPDAQLVTIHPNTSDQLERDLLSLANDQGLFFKKSLVHIQRLLPNKDADAIMKKAFSTLQESPSVFVWTEPDLTPHWIKKLESVGAVVKEFGQSLKSGPPDMFEVSNALLSSDRKKIWLKIKEAQQRDSSAENVFGILFWQLKNIVLAKTYNNHSAAGLKKYPYQKARQSSWQLDQLHLILQGLVRAQIKARTPGNVVNLWLELEAWSLGLSKYK